MLFITKFKNRAITFNMFWAFLVTQAITVPFFMHNHLTLSQIFIVQSVQMIAWLIIDVPSSYLTKFCNLKTIMIYASLFRLIGAIAFLLSTSFWGFIFTYIIIGAGNGMSSGINISILYENKANDWSSDQKVLQNNYLGTRLSTITALLLGAALSEYSLTFVALLNVVTAVLPLLLLLSMPSNIFGTKQDGLAIKNIIIFFKGNNIIFYTIIYCFYNSFLTWSLYFNQLSFLHSGYSIFSYGAIIASFQLMFLIYNFKRKVLSSNIKLYTNITATLTSVAFLMCSRQDIFYLVVGFLLIEVIRFLVNTVLLNYINQYIKYTERPLFNSVIIFITILFTVIFSNILSVFIGHFSWANMSMAIFIILVFIALSIIIGNIILSNQETRLN